MDGMMDRMTTGYHEMPDWLGRRAFLSPDTHALETRDGTLTFSELDALAQNVSDALNNVGIRADDRVALLGQNSQEYIITVHGLIRARAVTVPINVRLSDDEMAWQLKDVQTHVLIADEANVDRANRLAQSLCRAGTDIKVISIRTLLSLGRFDRWQVDGSKISQRGPGQPDNSLAPRHDTLDLNKIQSIMYTSGTTGRPKGVLLTYGNHWWSAVGSALNMGLQSSDRWLLLLPLFHIGGLSILFRSVIYGSTIVMHDRFDAGVVNDAIDDDGITHVSLVTVMLRRLIKQRAGKPYPTTLRAMLTGGGPVPLPLLHESRAVGAPVIQTYGMTETASQAVTLPPADAIAKPGSSGKPLFPNEIRIDRDATSDDSTDAGEILVKGPTVSPGYWKGETTVTPDGWLRTGDVGYLDDEGYLYVMDRVDDMFISGGENIYPKEIERVLESHPSVEETAVIGVPDDEWGSVPVAFVVVKATARHELSGKSQGSVGDNLISYCREHLAPFKVPKSIRIVDSLPKNATGKLLKGPLRAVVKGVD